MKMFFSVVLVFFFSSSLYSMQRIGYASRFAYPLYAPDKTSVSRSTNPRFYSLPNIDSKTPYECHQQCQKDYAFKKLNSSITTLKEHTSLNPIVFGRLLRDKVRADMGPVKEILHKDLVAVQKKPVNSINQQEEREIKRELAVITNLEKWIGTALGSHK